jgi:hypothetical protein
MVMENFAKQMMDFQKATFDNAFTAVVMLQDQAERMLHSAMEQAEWLPKEGRAMVDQWVRICKTGRSDFKRIVDDSYDKMTDFVTGEAVFAAAWETKETKPAKAAK